jgi:hypothetical protein
MMHKQAAPGTWALIKSLVPMGAATTDAITNSALYLLGAAAIGGGAIGAFGAQLTAHGKQDEDTVKKEYENERLKADVGYVASRLEDEYNRSKNATKPKAARVLNV